MISTQRALCRAAAISSATHKWLTPILYALPTSHSSAVGPASWLPLLVPRTTQMGPLGAVPLPGHNSTLAMALCAGKAVLKGATGDMPYSRGLSKRHPVCDHVKRFGNSRSWSIAL